MWQVEVSHKSEMAGPFNRGDTIINKHFIICFNHIFICFCHDSARSQRRFKAYVYDFEHFT